MAPTPSAPNDQDYFNNNFMDEEPKKPQVIGKWGAARNATSNEPISLGYFGVKKKKKKVKKTIKRGRKARK